MMQRLKLPAVALACAGLGAAGVATYQGVLKRPGAVSLAPCGAGGKAFARLELMFGMGKQDGSTVSQADWHLFLDAEVTPRFPDGLTVLAGYGQWRGPTGVLAKEDSRMLLIWYQPAADADTKIEALRAAYKARFGQESVLRADGISCVSF